LKVDENKNLVRDASKNVFLLDGTLIPVHQDGEDRGKAIDAGKVPMNKDQQRTLG
jgi:hypothetical protein